MPKPTVLEQAQCIAEQSMRRLDGVNEDQLSTQAAVEQVRATYALNITLARVHEVLESICDGMPMAGRGI